MRKALWLPVLAVVALTGCEKKDEDAKLKAEIDQVYQKKAEAAQHTPPKVGNVDHGLELAKKCQPCHGIDGVSGNMGAPFIAGMEQAYLVSAMLAYRDGSRKNTDMKAIATALSPLDIADVSDYYASLPNQWKGEHVGTHKPSTATFDQATIAAGAALAARCNSCHGDGGRAIKDDIPALAAMSPEYFSYALKTYFNGKREHNVMKIFRTSTSDNEIRQMGAYYASQDPRKPPKPTQGSYQAGEAHAADCAGCHGIDGNSLNPEIPSLAGQPAGYLVHALKQYRDGQRREGLMNAALRKMPDKQINDLAAYYAQQQPESMLKVRQLAIKTFNPIGQGQQIASSCNGCHGPNGNSTKPGTPSLTGLGIKYFVSAGTAYRDKIRKHAEMTKMVGHLTDADFEKAGFYYGLQEPVLHKKPGEFDLKAAEKIYQDCVSCHGEKGISHDTKTPSLAGQDADYLVRVLREYASGVRPSDAMQSPAQGLKEPDLINITRYLASLTSAKPPNNVPDNPQVSITVKCARCHGENGNSTELGVPSLAGQSEAYLALALKEYQDGRRKHKAMKAMSDVLSIVEIKAIAAFYAKQERKTVTP